MKLLFTLICDDVRFENTNKLLFIGVYNYTITFPANPVPSTGPSAPAFVLAKLCIVRRWVVESSGQKAKTEVRDPSGKPLMVMDREVEVSKDDAYTHEIFQILGPVLVPGTYTITTTYEDRGLQTNEERFEVRVVNPASVGLVAAQPVLNSQG